MAGSLGDFTNLVADREIRAVFGSLLLKLRVSLGGTAVNLAQNSHGGI